MATQDGDWTKPQAMAIPEGGYFEYKEGLSGPIFPKTPACYGFTIIAKVKPGREAAMRAYGDTIEKALKADPNFWHRSSCTTSWVLFDNDNAFSCTRASSTPTSTSTPRTPSCSSRRPGINTAFENLEGFPEDWKTNAARSSSSSATTSARASSSTASIRTSPPTRSRRRCSVKAALRRDARPDAMEADDEPAPHLQPDPRPAEVHPGRPAGQRLLVLELSRRRRIATSAELDNRFSTMTEVRRVAWPAYEDRRWSRPLRSSRASPDRWSCSSGPGCRSSASSARSPATPSPCSSASIRPASACRSTSGCSPTPTRCSCSASTTWSPEQDAAPAEIEALRAFLAREGTCLVIGPHHDVGASDDLDERDMEYAHHGDALVPRQQRFGSYTRSLMRGSASRSRTAGACARRRVPARTRSPRCRSTRDLDAAAGSTA